MQDFNSVDNRCHQQKFERPFYLRWIFGWDWVIGGSIYILFDILNLPDTAVNINSQSFTSSSLFVIGRINWMQSYGLMAVITLVSLTVGTVSFYKCEFAQNKLNCH